MFAAIFFVCLIDRAPRHLRGREIHLADKGAKIGVIDHALEKFLIFAAMFRFALKKKIVQPDRRAVEGVGLDDIGTGLKIFGVDLLDDFGMGEIEHLEATFNVFALSIAKALASIIRLRKFTTLDHGAHRAVKNDD